LSLVAPGRNLGDSELELLKTISDEGARIAFVDANPVLQSAEIVSELCERVRAEVRVNAQHSFNLADAAIIISQKLMDTLPLGKSFRAKANALYACGDNSGAVASHEKAIEIFERAVNREELARTLSGSLQPLILLGQYERAYKAAERARSLFQADGNTWRIARLEINIGNIHYRQDRFAEAMQSYERAYDELIHRKDVEGLAAVLSNMATCFISLNAFSKALDIYEQARQHCELNGMPLLVAQADYNIAYLYYLRGEYVRAIEMLRRARLECKKVGDSYHFSLCNLDLSELYLELNLSKEATELAREGFAGFESLHMGYESAKCRAFVAIAASQDGRAFEALKLFNEAREIFVREKNHVWPALIDLYRALVLFEEGRYFEARRLCSDAAECFRSAGLHTKAILAELLLARIALKTENPEAALRSCKDAASKLGDLEAPVLQYQTYFFLGQSFAATGDDQSAYSAYQRAKNALETLRSSLRGEELKIAFLRNRLEVYECLIDLCLKSQPATNTTEDAFSLIEQAKSRGLMDLLLQPLRTATENDPGQSELVKSIRSLREELNWYYSLIEREELQPEEKSQEKVAALQRQARARETDLLRVLQDASLAEAEQGGVPVPTNLPLETIRAALPPRTCLIEYFKLRDRIVVCVLTKNDLQVLPVTIESRIGNTLRLLQFQLSKFRFDPAYIAIFQESLLKATNAHLHELYQELIAPIIEMIDADNLVVVPHGLLHYIPFHALFDGKHYLIDRFMVSYAPSGSIFALCQQRDANCGKGSIVLGVPDSQAPDIQKEVESVASALEPAQLFVGSSASEYTLRTKGPGSRVVHIASHGHFRTDNPMFSAIQLGGSNLSVYDLYQLKLPAGLVTLSGCSTGLNVVAAGDELIGLSRGLLQAGAESLILSLWDVHDKSTTEFMTLFYRLLVEGRSKASALQSAMRKLRESYPHPYQWAPFTLVGKI
jgi:CHAT domain-containing protein